MARINSSAAAICVAMLTAGCVVGGAIRPTLEHPTDADMGRLWLEPVDLTERNLFYGPGGQALMPVAEPAA